MKLDKKRINIFTAIAVGLVMTAYLAYVIPKSMDYNYYWPRIILLAVILIIVSVSQRLKAKCDHEASCLEEAEKQSDIKNVKVHRTKEGTILEIGTVLLLVAAWVVLLTRHRSEGDIQDEWIIGDRSALSFFILMTIGIIGILIGSYFPRFNIGRRTKNIQQLALNIRRNRVIALEAALFLLCASMNGTSALQLTLLIVAAVIIWATSILFHILIRKAS